MCVIVSCKHLKNAARPRVVSKKKERKIVLSKIFRFFKGIVYNFFAKTIIPPKKQCFGSGFNQISGSGSGFRIRIPDSDSGLGFRIRIPD